MPTTDGSTPFTRSRSRTTTTRAHGLPRAARDQRRPRRAGRRLPDARASRHGDRLVRARGRARAQGLDGHRLGDPPGRRAAHDARAPACATASSTRRRRGAVHFLQIWILPERGASRRATSRRRSRRPRSAVACVSSRRRDGRDGSVTVHSGRLALRGALRRSGVRDVRPRERTERMAARRARDDRSERRDARERGTESRSSTSQRSRSATGGMRKSCCSTSRERVGSRASATPGPRTDRVEGGPALRDRGERRPRGG